MRNREISRKFHALELLMTLDQIPLVNESRIESKNLFDSENRKTRLKRNDSPPGYTIPKRMAFTLEWSVYEALCSSGYIVNDCDSSSKPRREIICASLIGKLAYPNVTSRYKNIDYTRLLSFDRPD